MPTSAERHELWAVDTSVAVPALDAGHAAHAGCLDVVRRLRPALAGHAAFEVHSVVTRMPGDLAVSAPIAAALIARVFPEVYWPGADVVADLRGRLGALGVQGGAVYDALVGAAANSAGAVLLTRDLRARRTYDLLGVRYELVGG